MAMSSSSYELPSLTTAQIYSENGLFLVAEQIGALLHAEVPGFLIRAHDRIDINNPPVYTRDRSMIVAALAIHGFKADSARTMWPRTKHGYGNIVNIGHHLDGNESGEEGTVYYPFAEGLTLRRNIGACLPAEISMAFSEFKAIKRGKGEVRKFSKSSTEPVYQATQQPGDRMVFIATGGILNSGRRIIYPAVHNFKAKNGRTTHIDEYVFWPSKAKPV